MTVQGARFPVGHPMTAQPPLVSERPVAIVCNAVTLGVMMASPADLEDFALGFAVTEGVILDPSELREIEIVDHANGTEARLWLSPAAAVRAAARHRAMTGPVGCGLCGIDSLDKVDRPLPPLSAHVVTLTRAEACAAPDLLRLRQPEHDRTRGCHAAGFLIPGRGIVLAREDVGRHNALDKLAGALVKSGLTPASGAVVLTSRVSTEMVQKAVMMGAATVIAVSTATDYAVRLADRADLTLITRVRDGHCEVLSAPHRLLS